MNNTFPGINPNVRFNHLSIEEENIMKFLAKEWYVTNGGGIIWQNSGTKYKYALIKPTRDFQETFNIEREMVVVFSPYENFEPRTLDVFDRVLQQYADWRIENICYVLVGMDKNIKEKVQKLLRGDPESRIVIPFSYEEFLYTSNSYFVKNRFRAFFFERDLFAFESPITKDFFFFGRSGLIQKIINRHKSNENSGLFGLRKTGKTSVINGVSRALRLDEAPSVIIDCQNPSLNQRGWNHALSFVIKEIKKQNEIQCIVEEEARYTPEEASSMFEKDIKRLFRKIGEKPILLIFDEIENISPRTSPNPNWKEGIDFVLFWQAIRAAFQKFIRDENGPVFSFLIVGTNPKAIETARINMTDNPMFNKVPFEFIQGFSIDQTKEMVSKLGGYMGLEFDDVVFSKLKEDFGGHPYLIRHVCSIINEKVDKNRPVKVDKIHYEDAKRIFNEKYSNYLEMILEVLIIFYPDEFDMLVYLAIGDTNSFNSLASEFPDLIAHLKGYNLIEENQNNFYFKIEAVKEYLINKNRYKMVLHTPEQRWREISERRNRVEIKLRNLIRIQMQSHFGKSDAFNKVIDIYGADRKIKAQALEYSKLFDASSIDIYFNDLIKIVLKYYEDAFRNIFGSNKEEVKISLEVINKYRNDAHAKEIGESDMEFFRVHISKIENIISEYI